MKKLLLLTLITLMPLIAIAKEYQANLAATSGNINTPSADTIAKNNVVLNSWLLLTDNTGFLPRLLISFVQNWEIGFGADFQKPNSDDPSYILNTKYKFYDSSSIKAAIGFDYQYNVNNTNTWNNYQFYLAFTWEGWAKTSAVIGKTFGDYASKENIDFGVGIEKILLSGDIGKLAIITDFSNYQYRNNPAIHGAGELNRGIFSAGVRVLFLNNRLNVDFIFTDLLDSTREMAASFSLILNF
ncbi:MAG TPA: hypothetical protein PKW55_00320 [Spirochaetota bacterium]|nr:hypothetical protein [Spirochaetota bacterium]HOM37802.1 hypothetical protein [Spirochaetota bacterium]HPQ49321.1 hypothetical protein [Spirochaetota bacterium]